MSSDNSQFLRKVVKFVSNPTTDWSVLDQQGARSDAESLDKAEIKAMIERRRRNDFVRKRELDMLRRIRRHHNNAETQAQVSFPSAIDSGIRDTPSGGNMSDAAVKAKIDEIEQQMVGAGARRSIGMDTSPAGFASSTQPDTLPQPWSPHAPGTAISATSAAVSPAASGPSNATGAAAGVSQPAAAHAADASSLAHGPSHGGLPPSVHHPVMGSGQASHGEGVLVNEWTHDAELDEAVIAFANADFEHCEKLLTQLICPGGSRQDHTDTWMVLFDLYRVLDQAAKFDTLATTFIHRFGLSAPQWYALPERVAAHMAAGAALGSPSVTPSAVKSSPSPALQQPRDLDLPKAMEGWIAPLHLHEEAISRLQFEVLQLPRPWALDWAGVESVNAKAASLLTGMLKRWAQDVASMTWVGVDQLFKVLEELSPTSDRNADPAFWMLRLELLRFCNRADQFDEVAIDYCITYEQSPPSWEPCACKIRLLADATCTQSVHLSHISSVSTSFVESQLFEEADLVEMASLELSGQLVGDIEDTLSELEKQLGNSVAVSLDCTYLIRVDFVAAGDLLNWVLGRRAEHRRVELVNPHRLLALFFGAMGITEHARLRLQTI